VFGVWSTDPVANMVGCGGIDDGNFSTFATEMLQKRPSTRIGSWHVGDLSVDAG
jgi:hypothetical protein